MKIRKPGKMRPLKKETKYWILFVLVIGAGFIARIVLSVKLGNKQIWPDTTYYLENARSILLSNGYDPHFYRGPGYSYFIAAIFTVLPDTLITVRIIQSILWVGIILLYYIISLNLFGKKVISLIVITFLSLHPFLIYLSSTPSAESLFIFVYSLSLLGAYMYRTNRKILILLFSGFCLGSACLVKSTAFLFLPFMILWIIIENKRKIRNLATHSIVFLCGFLVVAIPYMIRLHHNLGYWALNGYGTRFLWKCTVHPLYGFVDNVIENPDDMTIAQREKVKRYTPPIQKSSSFAERNYLYKQALLKYIKENPKEYICKLFGKFLNIFCLTVRTNMRVIDENSILIKFGSATSLGFVYVFFLIGLIVSRTNRIEFLPLLAILLGSFIVFTIYHSRVRYTLSVFPVMILFSSFGVYFTLRKLKLTDS